MVWYIVLVLFMCGLGWIYGFIANLVFTYIMGYVLKWTMNLEMMTGNDEIFFLDDHRNRFNIVAFHRCEKFDYEEMARTMVTRACIFPRLKSKVTKFLGKYMFEEMSDEDMINSIRRTCPKVDDIHNEQ